VFNARCWTRAIAGRELQQALADCGESLRLRPNEANTHDSLAFTHLKLGDLDRALAEYNTALGLNSRLPGSLYGRGIVELRKGDATAAEMDIQAAKAIQAGIADEFAKYGIAP
jgi:tetratricopeptide (TPR) repeat protein